MMYVCLLVVDLLQVRWRDVNYGMKRLVIGDDDISKQVGVCGRRGGGGWVTKMIGVVSVGAVLCDCCVVSISYRILLSCFYCCLCFSVYAFRIIMQNEMVDDRGGG